jgi:hypothetical protein
MPVDVDIDFPREDVRAMMRAIHRAEREVGKGLGNGMRMAGFTLAKSLGASTKIAPRYREYKQVPTTRKGQKKYEVVSFIGGKKHTFETYRRGVRELKKNAALIGRRGLAKGSWLWGARRAGQGRAVAKKDIRPSALRFAERHAGGEGRYRGDDPFIRITNQLPYIEQAMHGGPKAIEDAMRRGAKGLEIWLDDLLKKKMDAK